MPDETPDHWVPSDPFEGCAGLADDPFIISGLEVDDDPFARLFPPESVGPKLASQEIEHSSSLEDRALELPKLAGPIINSAADALHWYHVGDGGDAALGPVPLEHLQQTPAFQTLKLTVETQAAHAILAQFECRQRSAIEYIASGDWTQLPTNYVTGTDDRDALGQHFDYQYYGIATATKIGADVFDPAHCVVAIYVNATVQIRKIYSFEHKLQGIVAGKGNTYSMYGVLRGSYRTTLLK